MLEKIQQDIERLIALYEREKEERKRLQAALARSEGELEACRKRIAALESEAGDLKLTVAFMAPAGSRDIAQKKIDKLIREIDKCISSLEVKA